MDNIILGLLLLCNRTIYQLRERIEKGLNLMYSSSMGSIQAAVKKLLHCGYIDYEETVENGKYKKVYRITDSGKHYFLEWVNAPLDQQGVRFPGLVKVYFMGFSDKVKREASLQHYLSFLREQYCALEILCEEAKNTDIPENAKEIFHYQLASAFYGRDLYKFNIDWFENLLNKMRNGEI
ncbi:helix-turn-helix transcriptional regulator [Roseburia hominis]